VSRAFLAIMALVVVVCARSVLAQAPDDYVDVVDEYRTGDPNTAIRTLARWPERSVEDSIRQSAKRLRPGQIVAAVMLHTELGAAILDSLPSRTSLQFGHARTLIDALTERRDEREHADAVRLHWFRFVISLYAADGRLVDAEIYARDALGRFPRDPILIFQKGAILETARSTNSPSAALALLRGRAPASATRQEQTLEAAAAEFRRALAIDPHMAVARLHLGWVHVQLQDDRAREDLTAALADARNDGERYLAHLFLGGLAERQSRFDEAAQEYERTRQLCPGCQTPYIASSRIEMARGRSEQARELARRFAALERVEDDPWWTYRFGTPDDEALTWLRAEAHRP
jgi:tetratricopeptide (TPR) repeat protein